jgi:hypothetical protein
MLIPKITYVGRVLSTAVTPNVYQISFKNDTTTDSTDTITAETWSTLIISGTPVLLQSESTGKEFTIGFEVGSIYTVAVRLTITDSDNRQIRTTALVVSNGVDINVLTLGLNPNVMAEGIVNYELEESFVVVAGANILTSYTNHYLDLTANGAYDYSQTTNTDITHTFTSSDRVTTRYTVDNTAVGIAVNTLYVETTYTPVVTVGREVIVTSATDCTYLDTYTFASNVVEKLIGRAGVDNSEMNYLELVANQNCCNTSSTIRLHPTYTFTLTPDAATYLATTTTTVVGGITYNVYTVTLDIGGIAASILSTVTNTNGNNSDTAITSISSFATASVADVEFLVSATLTDPVIVETNQMVITTSGGFSYTVDYTMTPDFATGTVTISITNTTYPSYPSGISVIENANSTTIRIESTAVFGSGTTIVNNNVMPDGIYNITYNDSGLSSTNLTGCAFVNCNTYCRVIKALANQCDPVIKIYYDALVNYSQCTTLTCESVCQLYSLLDSKLDECDCSIYQTNTIVATKNCGCS